MRKEKAGCLNSTSTSDFVDKVVRMELLPEIVERFSHTVQLLLGILPGQDQPFMMHSAMLPLGVRPGNTASRSRGFASSEKAMVQGRVAVGKVL